jgi:hypothetical protein
LFLSETKNRFLIGNGFLYVGIFCVISALFGAFLIRGTMLFHIHDLGGLEPVVELLKFTGGEFDNTACGSEQSVIFALLDVIPGMEPGSALPDQDSAGLGELPFKKLYP